MSHYLPSESVAFLPTKNDPDACAVCFAGQPHKGKKYADLPHAMCAAAYKRLCGIVAGETPKARTPIKRKAIRPSRRKPLGATKEAMTEDGYVKIPQGGTYPCRGEGCSVQLVSGKGGALRKYCAACAKTRLAAQKAASARRRYWIKD